MIIIGHEHAHARTHIITSKAKDFVYIYRIRCLLSYGKCNTRDAYYGKRLI